MPPHATPRKTHDHAATRSHRRQVSFGLGGAAAICLGIAQALQYFVTELRDAAGTQRENHIAGMHALYDAPDALFITAGVLRAAMAELAHAFHQSFGRDARYWLFGGGVDV